MAFKWICWLLSECGCVSVFFMLLMASGSVKHNARLLFYDKMILTIPLSHLLLLSPLLSSPPLPSPLSLSLLASYSPYRSYNPLN